MNNFNVLDEFRLDGRSRHKHRSKRIRLAIRDAFYNRKSFMKTEGKIRGIQPLCRKCALKCKVLDGPNSTFICFDFVEKKK